MKSHQLCLVSLVLVSSFILRPSSLLGQGSLTPPGAPAPTMKTLSQVEPRTPISALPFTVTNGGSFYLTANLVGPAGTNGITIAVSDVTLDLAGFALIGTAGSSNGISVWGTRTNLAIANGAVRAWGGDGVNALGVTGGRYFNLSASHNGGMGLRVGDNAILKDCSARNNGGHGIDTGVNSTVSDCVAFQNTDGIWIGVGSTITSCAARENGGWGIVAGSGSSISGCTTHYNGTGIYVNNFCHVLNNNPYGNGYAGIVAVLDHNRIEGNNVTANGWGIRVSGTGNLIIRNSARANTTGQYDIGATNTVGEILDFSAGGGTVTNANPWANFSF
jgi:parallel beta-helix repeat protein